MPQNKQANNRPSEALNNDQRTSGAGLRGIVLAGGILLLVLLFVSVCLPNLTERVKFFTVNALSLLVLVAIVVQAYIYRRQWDVMERQAAISKAMIANAKDSFYLSERA